MKRFPRSNDKREWREWAMAARSECRLPDAADALIPRLTRLDEWVNARRVLLYHATSEEMKVHGVFGSTVAKEWHFPRCAAGRKLIVHRLLSESFDGWTRSRYGIDEPPANSPELAPEDLDLVVVPALAFDERGYRIGYGGGYYDRFLLRLRPDCVTVGVTLEALVVPALPAEPHDVPVQIIVTETRTIRQGDTTAPIPPPYSG